MPELPEVETIRRQLGEVLVGKSIKKVLVFREKSFGGDSDSLVGWEVFSVERKSKVIEIFFKNIDMVLIVHLKMTGQLVYVDGAKRVAGGHPTADWVKELPSKHTRVEFEFDDGSKLFFNDMRVFGWVRLIEKKVYEKDVRKKVPDVTEKDFTLEYFSTLVKKTGKAIKIVLMDQDKIGGVGNIYANDALYLAKVMPDRKASSLNESEVKVLYESVCFVINKGIKYGGASAANYVDTNGLGGTYQEHFLVYQKDGQYCKECNSILLKMKVGGRGTFYCPVCQG